ncbi:DUF3800 domain-containing protein [Streptosporangium carneum]|uniref:DUF3800 domain-containing protein n=1 Tax=Streptosporangium carneum TaxID=47481 RepID=A0A9W6I6Z9_9ACTN|nr:DUF3800 domain-containing protein [Streptosporangium carneum]GLK12110.1 hypothetical protein GCM10017600_55180 [Streptosporangium carneum]
MHPQRVTFLGGDAYLINESCAGIPRSITSSTESAIGEGLESAYSMDGLDGKRRSRTVYVDDSGDGRKWLIFSALSFDDGSLPGALSRWSGLRGELWERGLLDADVSLHAVNLAGGRGRRIHSYAERGLSRERHRENMRHIVLRGLQVIADMPGIRLHVAYRNASLGKRGGPELYSAMITKMNRDLAESGEVARIVIDGDGTNPAFREAHRCLPEVNRRIDGDPVFFPSRHCDLLQAADLVAYAAYQSLAENPNRSFMWDWYERAFPQAGDPIAL